MVNPGFRYTFLLRAARCSRDWGWTGLPVHVICRWLLRHYSFRYGISIPYNTEIGLGLYIGHFGGIVLNHAARLGNFVNLNHDVTIGAAYGGKFPGSPTIGDRVYIGPGARIIGGITVGSDAAIGANCVVTRPVPERAVVVGIPGEVISFRGSAAYVANADFPGGRSGGGAPR
jgi:serine O-acetyltransferase